VCKMYAPGIGIKLQREGEDWGNAFVGVWVYNSRGRLIIGDHNENASVVDGTPDVTKTRWPNVAGVLG